MSDLRITYRGKGHTYTLDGVKVPGVTSLISDGLPKPALVNWAGNTTAEYAVDHWDELAGMSPSAKMKALKGARFSDRDQAAARGTEVHALAEKLAAGEEVDVPEELAGHVESLVRFLDEWKPAVVASELVVANRRWNYAGKLDLIADLPGRGRCLLDYKTNRSGIFGEVALQLSAYAHAELYVPGDSGEPQNFADLAASTERAYAVWIRGDGYDVHRVDIGEHVFKLFLHVAHVAKRSGVIRNFIHDPERL